MNSEIIIRGHNIYIINQDDNESREIYYERVNYIIKRHKIGEDMSDIIQKSYLWRNINFYGMVYPISVSKNL
jgi:hypothetical protein